MVFRRSASAVHGVLELISRARFQFPIPNCPDCTPSHKKKANRSPKTDRTATFRNTQASPSCPDVGADVVLDVAPGVTTEVIIDVTVVVSVFVCSTTAEAFSEAVVMFGHTLDEGQIVVNVYFVFEDEGQSVVNTVV